MICHKELNPLQALFNRIFYWAAYYSIKETVDLFLDMGVSPFMKIFKGSGAFEAAIQGVQYNMLRYLIKDSSKIGKRYQIEVKSEKQKVSKEKYYYQSRKSKDSSGENACHSIFKIEDVALRNEFLELCMKENIGDLNKRNKLGLFPHEVQHYINFNDIPSNMKPHFLDTFLDSTEADYCIVTHHTSQNSGKK